MTLRIGDLRTESTCLLASQTVVVIVVAIALTGNAVGQVSDSNTTFTEIAPFPKAASTSRTGDGDSQTADSSYAKLATAVEADNSFNAKDIEELPPDVRAEFDKAFAELQIARRNERNVRSQLSEGTSILAEATRRLESEIPAESAQIRRQMNELPEDWKTILQTKDAARQRWLMALNRGRGVEIYEKLADDEAFRPLLAWWAELVFTDKNLAAWLHEEDAKGLLPAVDTAGSEQTVTRDEYLSAFLAMWQRYSDRHADELQTTAAGLEIPTSLPDLVQERFGNGAKHMICSTIKHLNPQLQLDTAVASIRQASMKCTSIWPQWGEYQKSVEQKLLVEAMAAATPAGNIQPVDLEMSSSRSLLLAANVVIIIALAVWFLFFHRNKAESGH